ncbi:MAG: hypothetical protein JNL65_11820 [Saprospiraceae bacterium]|nr:hypothetical protein [Saprospiraceae bacterium]
MIDVLNILKRYILNHNAQIWCDDLVNGDDDSKRLGICLAIELRKIGSEILNLNHIELIFDSCDYDHSQFITDNSNARKWFAQRIDSIKHNLRNSGGSIIASTEFISNTLNNNHYVTFLSFYRFKKYYLDKVGFYSVVDSNNDGQIEDFVELFPNLLDYIEFLGDSNYPIWVSTFDEYNRIKSMDDSMSCSTNVINTLGLYPDTAGMSIFPATGNMLFLIDYGSSFKITTYQPSSLNKNWINCSNDFYLSYIKDDCFGKTCSCNASNDGSKEQIHEQFICRDKGILTKYLGKYELIDVNKASILIEGIKRVNL